MSILIGIAIGIALVVIGLALLGRAIGKLEKQTEDW